MADEMQRRLPELCALLQDAVAAGASVGFLPPLPDAVAAEYWQGVSAALGTPDHLLFVAQAGDTLIGTVQLYLESRPNGTHRAEVRKLLVHTAARDQSVATALMQALESAAWQQDRSLLVLDTIVGDVAERLYLKLGYQVAGIIPNFARSATGVLEATVVMYKLLLPPTTP